MVFTFNFWGIQLKISLKLDEKEFKKFFFNFVIMENGTVRFSRRFYLN